MKKLLLVALAGLLILTAARFNPEKVGPSHYYSQDYAHVLMEGVTTRLVTWSPQQEAVVMLTDGIFYPQSYGGLLRVSGICELKRPAELFSLRLVTNNAATIMSVYPLYESAGRVASFNASFPATQFYIEAMQVRGDVNANRARCVVTVEAVR